METIFPQTIYEPRPASKRKSERKICSGCVAAGGMGRKSPLFTTSTTRGNAYKNSCCACIHIWATVPIKLVRTFVIKLLRFALLRHRLPEPVITFGIRAPTSGKDSCSMMWNALLKNCSRNTTCPCSMVSADFHTLQYTSTNWPRCVRFKKTCCHLRCSRSVVYSTCLPSFPTFLRFSFIDGKRRSPTKWASPCCTPLLSPIVPTAKKKRMFQLSTSRVVSPLSSIMWSIFSRKLFRWNFVESCWCSVARFRSHCFNHRCLRIRRLNGWSCTIGYLQTKQQKKYHEISKIVAEISKRSFPRTRLNCTHDPMRVVSCVVRRPSLLQPCLISSQVLRRRASGHKLFRIRTYCCACNFCKWRTGKYWRKIRSFGSISEDFIRFCRC